MRTVQIPIVVSFTDEQEREWAADNGLPFPVRAKDVVDNVQSYALLSLQGSTLGQFASITIKGR